MKYVTLPCGEKVPALGQGSWFLGDDPATRNDEIAALQAGIERGLSLIDTAEMYGDGRAERLVGEAIAGRRDDVFLVSKVLPSNAGRERALAACEASLERLGTECLDLYLLHWQGGVPYEDTISAFEQLQRDGKIRHFGISNLDLPTTRDFQAAPGGDALQVNQLLYNLNQRGIEWELLPWLQNQGIATMAYSPFDGASLLSHDGLQQFARERDITAAQAALAWLLDHDGVLPIPKSASTARVEENAGALDMHLSEDDRAALDALFAPPNGPQELQIY
ncbi:oxidoreductase (2,5-didehydrogluconate reductase) [Salinisphaera dokdonensis CL-ES53]|uniref:Oxidoreductase (2,5-didehydrogluconate reductase) n=1 Tax=Salinisphaera dokdonensis CL-ES53 TaxID=1304272 RepID=A0ABV2AVJ3_9GAMM